MVELRTLIVDDDPDQRSLTLRLLARAGIGPAVEAVDAEDALRRAAEHDPELVLLDLGLPGRSGLDVLPELLEACPTASIVVVSNLPRRRYEDEAVRLGAVGYVEKRVAPDRLVDEVLAAAALSSAVLARATADLRNDPGSPREARGLARSVLAEEDQRLVHTVELLVSELVTNSVIHTSTAPRVEVELLRGTVRVAVYDADPHLPERRTPDLDRPGGRGLLFLEEMAARWAAEPSDTGKVVWFEIDR